MRKIIPIILVILMIVMFCFSAQPANESSETSSGFCIIFAKFLYLDYENYDIAIQTVITSGLEFIIRKTAHFTEYAFMGFLWYLYLADKKYNILISIGATGVYACTDEVHQLFVEGRSGQISDVLLDTCGGCFGVLIAFIILC
ncbi:MAG: VanZ family protein, partial [Oscillospiraceae bacterium]|nr:VanZ family protein [Oscillospiraceae bacterium]